jgi:hypothetical protein
MCWLKSNGASFHRLGQGAAPDVQAEKSRCGQWIANRDCWMTALSVNAARNVQHPTKTATYDATERAAALFLTKTRDLE